MKNHLAFCLFAAYTLPVSLLFCPARAQEVSFEHITVEDGLPANVVFSLLQDRYGFIWLGTSNGLVRYDGVNMTVFQHDPDNPDSPAFRIAYSLLEDSKGNLWIGSAYSGLFYLNRATERFTHYYHDPQDSTSLSADAIAFIHEDRRGDIWLVTGDLDYPNRLTHYLDRLDPETGIITRFRHNQDDPHSLGSDQVSYFQVSLINNIAFLEDSGGNVWVGTEGINSDGEITGGGLNRYDVETGTFTHYRHDSNSPHSLSHDRVRNLYEDSEGRLWIGTEGGGVNLLNPETESFTHFRHDPDDPNSLSSDVAAVVYEDRFGDLWIITDSGLDCLDTKTRTFTHYRHIPDDPTTPSHQMVLPFYEDEQDNLWIITHAHELNCFDRETKTFTRYAHDTSDPGSFNSGTSIRSYLVDRSDILWVGTHHAGLNKLDLTRPMFHHYWHNKDEINRVSDNYIQALYEAPSEPGIIWIGTGEGLDRLDRSTVKFTHYKHDPDNPGSIGEGSIRAVYEDKQGRFWVGSTSGGLCQMDRETGLFTCITHAGDDPTNVSLIDIWCITEDRQSKLWLGTTSRGLNVFDPETNTFTGYAHDPDDPGSLSSNEVLTVHEDSEGRMWIGTNDGGLNLFDRDTETFTAYSNLLSGPFCVTTIYEDREGRLWLGDHYAGLLLFDRETGTNTSYNIAQGLPSNAVRGIAEDDSGHLWIGTSGGLARFDPEEEVFYVYDDTKGIDFWRALKSKEGHIFFGTVSYGFFAFDPADIRGNPSPPQAAFTDFRLFDKKVQIGYNSPLRQHISLAEKITLTHSLNDLSIGYAGLHFSRPEEITYRYQLEGYEANWRDVGTSRTAIYPNLPPGDYTFRVQAASVDGIWSEEDASVLVTVLPPWWRTTWAYVLYSMFLIGAVVGAFRVQRSRIVRKEREIAQIREAELKAESAELRATSAELQAKASDAQARTLEVENERNRIEVEKARELEKAYKKLKTTQAQLIQSEKMASLGQLTAGIAHEIKNPLNFVNNFSEVNAEVAEELADLLAKYGHTLPEGIGEEMDDLLSSIKVNATHISKHGKRADSIVNSMMEHAREGGGQRLHVGLNPFVEENISLSHNSMLAQHPDLEVEIERNFDEAVGNLEMSPQEMGRALINVLNNAFDAVIRKKETAGESFEPTVRVETSKVDSGVEIRVRDNGPGIPADIKERIFEPFFTTKPTGSGTGLGLSLAYDIVTQGHGGTMTVDSTEGKGATFVIWLPG